MAGPRADSAEPGQFIDQDIRPQTGAAQIRHIVDTNLVLQVLAAGFGLAGQYFVNQRNVTGFYLWLLSNAALIVFQVMHQFWVFVGLHIVYFLMAVHGIYMWKGGKTLAQLRGRRCARA